MKTKENGITLVALVVTIIVMIILASISLNASIGENGIIAKTTKGKRDEQIKKAEDDIISGIKRVDYYENTSADVGKNINSVYSMLDLQKYISGRVNGINSLSNQTVFYYTNDVGSYTLFMKNDGKIETKEGIYLESKSEEPVNIYMNIDETVNLTSDIEIERWVTDSDSSDTVILDAHNGIVTKKGKGIVKIYGYSDGEKKVTVTINDMEHSGVEYAETAIDTLPSSVIDNKIFLGNNVYAVLNSNVLTVYKDSNTHVSNDKDGVMDLSGLFEHGVSLNKSEDNLKVEKIIVNNGIKVIADNFFDNFTNTKSLSLPKSLEKIGSLGKIEIDYENDVTVLTTGLKNLEELHYNCENLKEYEVVNRVVSPEKSPRTRFPYRPIRPGTIRYSKLTKLYIEKDVKVLNSFLSGIGITDLVIPSNVERIEEYAFGLCENLQNLVISNGVKSIGVLAFYANYKLDNVRIPDSVTDICDGAFSYDTSMTNIVVGRGIKNIGLQAIGANEALKSIIIRGTGYRAGNYAFCENIALESINTEGCVYWGYDIFYNCINLREVTIPYTLEYMGRCPFYNCNNLKIINYNAKNLEVDHDVDEYGNETYYKTIVMSNGATRNNVNTINIGESVEIIPPWFFSRVIAKSVEIPDNLKTIKECAFYYSELEKVKCGNSLDIIEEYAFHCSKINDLDLGNSVKEIQNHAFSSNQITVLTIPESVEIFGNFCFGYNPITVLNYNAIDASTEECYKSYSDIPDNIINTPFVYNYSSSDKVKTQYTSHYKVNSNITQINIGNKVKKLDKGLFVGAKITEITIPSSVESISYGLMNFDNVFYDCEYLNTIYIKKPSNSILGAPWSNNDTINVVWE